jgi:hypothetical protein
MRDVHGARTIGVGILFALVLTAGGLAGVAQADRTTSGIAADHVVACLKTAVAAQPGLVKEVEVEYKGTQWLCEVKLVDEAGKRHKLHIDVATNQVVKAK